MRIKFLPLSCVISFALLACNGDKVDESASSSVAPVASSGANGSAPIIDDSATTMLGVQVGAPVRVSW